MNTSIQVTRFLILGAVTNISLYIIYLLITSAGMGHKIAMTITYLTGVIIGFILNRNWTFQDSGHITPAFFRHVMLYFIGYILNLLGLYLLVDIAQQPHQIVQFFLIVILAIMFFILQKIWVFRSKPKGILKYVIFK